MNKAIAAIAAVLLFGSWIYAQSPMAPAIYIGAGDIAESMNSSLAERPNFGVGRIDIGEDYRINLIRRGSPAGAIVHEEGTELHYITAGAGTLVTGGVAVRPDGGGPARIEGGLARQVTVGDAILIPEGTPHQYTAVEGVVEYLEVRFEAAQY